MLILLKRFALAALMLALVTAFDGRAVAVADVIVDATSSGGGFSSFGTLDLTTGVYTQISTLTVSVGGLTSDPSGTIYASATDGFLYTINSGVASQFGTISAPFPSGGTQIGYQGLAYAGTNGFYAVNVNGPATSFLDQITPSATSVVQVGDLTANNAGSGSLAFGPNGTLYLSGADAISGAFFLYSVNTTTGAATAIGSGLVANNNDGLTIVSAGGQLYGIDTFQAAGSGPISIYTIDTTLGTATDTGVTVSGLTTGFTLDTATAVPEPSALVLFGIGGGIALAVARVRRKRAA